MQRPRVPGARERSRRTTRAAFADAPPPPPAGSASWLLSRLSVPGNSRSNSARELPCARDSSAAAAFGCDLRMARDVNLEDSPVKNTQKTNSPFTRSRDRRFVDRAPGQNSLSNAEAKRWTCQKRFEIFVTIAPIKTRRCFRILWRLHAATIFFRSSSFVELKPMKCEGDVSRYFLGLETSGNRG
jgi:hypothetical protein